MSTRYRRGRDFEYRVRDELRAMGYWVIRSAGSKGAVDLLALHATEPMLFVQCKRDGKLPAAESCKLRALARLYHAKAVHAHGPGALTLEPLDILETEVLR